MLTIGKNTHPDDFLIKDYEYKLKTGIEITFEDWFTEQGYMTIDVFQ